MCLQQFSRKDLIVLSATLHEQIGALEGHVFNAVQHIPADSLRYKSVGGRIFQSAYTLSPIFHQQVMRFHYIRRTKVSDPYTMRLKTLRRSHRKEKKYDAIFEMPDGRTKTVPFGQKGYSDFTKHKDTRRRARYINRHSGMGEDWTDPATPGALSRYILWNKPTLSASLRDFKKRFHV